jgi:hypothetical protein
MWWLAVPPDTPEHVPYNTQEWWAATTPGQRFRCAETSALRALKQPPGEPQSPLGAGVVC